MLDLTEQAPHERATLGKHLLLLLLRFGTGQPFLLQPAPECLRNAPPDDWIYTVSGAAWAGETDVTEIAVSTDCGQTWAEAEFLDPMRRHAWRRWKFDWLTPKEPGQYTLLARAKDASGLLQPDKHDQNYGSLRDQSLSPN